MNTSKRITVAALADEFYAHRAEQRDVNRALMEGLSTLLAASGVTADAPARTAKPSTKPAAKAAKPQVRALPLTAGRRKAFIAAAAKDGWALEGWSTWELAFWAVSTGYAPKGFCIGERYTALAVEAGA